MRDGPVSDVPLTIKIINNAVIAMWIGPDRIDSHFGADPVYGTLVTDEEQLAKIQWPVLGVFVSEYPAVPVESAREFKAVLDFAGATNEIYIYDGVGHAFANPSGDNYAPEETADAWDKTIAFLEKCV